MAIMAEAVGKSLTTVGAAATQASDTANTTPSDEDLRKDVEDKQRAADAARKGRFSDDIIAVLQAELGGKRAALQAGKPLVAQLKTAERMHAEAVAKLAAHKEKASVLLESIDDAKNALAEHKGADINLQTKVDKARDEVDELRQQSLAVDSSEDASEPDPFALLPATWRAVLQKQGGKKDELVAEFNNVVQEQQATAKAKQAATEEAAQKVPNKGEDVMEVDATQGTVTGEELMSEGFLEALFAKATAKQADEGANKATKEENDKSEDTEDWVKAQKRIQDIGVQEVKDVLAKRRRRPQV